MKKTDILFFFDTEDIVNECSCDAIRDLADIFTSEGIRAHFAVVGYLARQLVQWKRYDVLASLKPHCIGTHTLYHSVHPDICEITDKENFQDAYLAVLTQESEAAGMVKAVTGADRLLFAVPPGDCKSYAAMYAYADMGIPFYCDTVLGDRRGSDVWYINQRHIPYYFTWEALLPGEERDTMDAVLERMAGREMAILYAHPHMAVCTEHWDAPNYKGGNLHAFGHWAPAKRRSTEDTKLYYERIREGIHRIQSDPRFNITDLDTLLTNEKKRSALTQSDIPAILSSLKANFGPVREPSLCLSDIFACAVRFLQGADSFTPGYVYGFLEKPEGVKETITLTASEIIEASKSIRLNTFLPARITVGSKTIGPADYLFAALEILCGKNTDTVTIEPKEQLGNMDHLPDLRDMHIKGGWLHTPEFADAYLSDRLRWQLWTYRYERQRT